MEFWEDNRGPVTEIAESIDLRRLAANKKCVIVTKSERSPGRWLEPRSSREGILQRLCSREQAGFFPTLQIHFDDEDPRPSGAWTGHPPE
jgi:hypothetical protein